MTATSQRERIDHTHAPMRSVSLAPEPPPVLEPSRPSLWQRLLQSVPTALVIAALAGVGAWGRATDWTVPKFSTLIGSVATEEDPWCEDHNVPESICIECNHSLAAPEKDYGWCKEHGVTNCPFEHPDVAQLKTSPAVTADQLDSAQRALALRTRDENNSHCTLHTHRIQFASTQAVAKAGVDVAVVERRPILEAAIANGEVTYDETRMAHLSSRVAGSVWRVQKEVGDQVKRGDVLAVIDAGAIGVAKSAFVRAISEMRLKQTEDARLRPLAKIGAVSDRELREVVAAYEEARINLQAAQQMLINLGFQVRAEDYADVETDEIAERLRFLDLPPEMTAGLDPKSTTSNLIPLRASLDGVIVDRHVVEGEVVEPTTMLFAVADVSRLWLKLDVRQEDAKYLSLGQTVLFRESGDDSAEVKGSINWISTAADDVTRTLRVRADLPNPGGFLRANTFGAGRIVLREEPQAIVVPTEAVHWDGTCHVVFVRDKDFLQKDSPKFFHVRSVRPGVADGVTTEIIAGLLPGEVIASRNSMVLEAQLLKSNLGAGCACCAGPKKEKE
jgi:cobalt-zinc-cadmium efflux system membrane fusion protein